MRAVLAFLFVLLADAPASAEMVKSQRDRVPAAAEVKIPVLLDRDFAVGDVDVAVAYAQRGDIPVGADVFKGSKLEPTAPPSRSATLALTMSMAGLPPGVYTVGISIVDVRAKAGAKRQPSELLKVEVVQAASRLATPAKLTLVCTGSCDGEQVRLVLRETAKAAGVSGLSLRWSVSEVGSGKLIAAKIACVDGTNNSVVEVPAGGQVELTCSSSGTANGEAFPLGTTTGVLSVMGEPLGEVLAIPVEVRVRCGWWWVPAFISIGVFLGFIVRVFLKRWLDRADAARDASQLLAVLAEARGKAKDPSYADAIDAIAADLFKALNDRTSDLPKAITAAVAAKKEADHCLQTRFQTASSDLEQVETQVHRPWTLPAELEGHLERHRALARKARAALEAGNVTQAKEHTDELDNARPILVHDAVAWAGQVNARFSALANVDQQELKAAAAAAFSALGTLSEATAAEEAMEISSTFRLAVGPLLEQKVDSLRPELAKARAAIESRPEVLDPNGEAQESIGETLKRLNAARSFEERLAALEALAKTEAILRRVLEAAVRDTTAAEVQGDPARKKEIGDARKKEIRDRLAVLLDQRRYEEAVKLIVTPDAHLSDPPISGTAPPRPRQPPTPTSIPVAAPQGTIQRPTVVDLPRQGLVTLVRWAVTLFAGLGIVALGTTLFASGFVGHGKEIAELLAWGFAANVSVDALVTTAAGMRK